jgi:hypothetical protein
MSRRDGTHSPLRFTPSEHLLETVEGIHANIANIPGDPTHLVRWMRLSQSEDYLRGWAQVQRFHLAKLGELGITIPHFDSFIGNDPSGKTTLFNRVERLEHRQMMRSSPMPQGLLVAEALEEYLDWLPKSGESQYLSDIFTVRQYGILPTGAVALLDIEPETSLVHRTDLTNSRMLMRQQFSEHIANIA